MSKVSGYHIINKVYESRDIKIYQWINVYHINEINQNTTMYIWRESSKIQRSLYNQQNGTSSSWRRLRVAASRIWLPGPRATCTCTYTTTRRISPQTHHTLTTFSSLGTPVLRSGSITRGTSIWQHNLQIQHPIVLNSCGLINKTPNRVPCNTLCGYLLQGVGPRNWNLTRF